MAAAASWSLETEFPDPFGRFIALIRIFSELTLPRLLPLKCVFEADYDFHDRLLVLTITPLALVGVTLACAVMLSRRGNAQWSEKCYSAALLIIFIILPTTSTTLFRTLQ